MLDFKTYIKAVGTGPKGNRDLSYEESKDMMTQILNATAPKELISAFLLGWRLKPETNGEFKGALNAIDSLSKKTEIKNSIELGYPFDGKAKNPYLLPLISQALKSNDLNLVVLGDELQPAKGGLTTKELVNKEIFEKNLHFFDRSEYCKSLHNLTELRQTLGLRTAFNTIEKLPNISSSEFAITGVHHKPYVKKYIEIFAHRYKRFAVIQGNEGTPELFKKGTLWISQEGELKEYRIDPKEYGVEDIDDIQGLAILNAAIWLFVADKYASVEEAFKSLNT